MPRKTLSTDYKGNDIRVENTWFHGAKLFVNDELRDMSIELFATGRRPVLRTTIETGRAKDVVEVFGRAIVTVKLKICVNGEQIAGDRF